jgi:hypothetical protein
MRVQGTAVKLKLQGGDIYATTLQFGFVSSYY